MSTITQIAWDFGNVLNRFDHSKVGRNIARLAPGLSADDVNRWIFQDHERHRQLDEGQISAGQFLSDLCRKFDLDVSHDAVAAAYADIFDEIPERYALVRRIPPGIAQCIASNTDRMHFTHRVEPVSEALGIHTRVVSFEVGVKKPARRFYERLLKVVDRPAEEVLFVDDLAQNCEAAEALGIRAVRCRDGVDLEREFRRHGIELLP